MCPEIMSMPFNSAHSGPEIDAAVQMLGQIQDARDSTGEDLAEVKVLASEVGANASQVQAQAESVAVKSEQVSINALAVESARVEVLAASTAAEDSKDAAAASAGSAATSRSSANASAQAAAQSEIAAGLSEQVTAENAAQVELLTEQVRNDSASARSDAESADASAQTASRLIEGHGNKRYGTYAAMTADPQTRDGIIGIVDADATSSRNGWYAWNNTTKAWVYFVDQPLMSAAYNARLDGSEGIFSSIEEGLRNTRGTGLARRYFRLTSTDQYYESRYRNDNGTAFLMDRVLRDPARLDNEIPNGSFRNMGAGNRLYGDLFPESPRQSPIGTTTDTDLAAIGCYAGFSCPSTDSVNTGNFVEVEIGSRGFDKVLQVLASVVVKSDDGTFNFGTHPAAGPAVYRRTASGEENGRVMTEYTEITPYIRVYTLLYRGFAPTDGSQVTSYRLGFNVSYPRSANLFVTGLWLSLDPIGYSQTAKRSLADTKWPAWDSVEKTRSLDADLALAGRVKLLEKPKASALKSLSEALRNPLHSAIIAAIGDSITAGSGAEYTGEGENNAKFNVEMRSWVNLTRKNFGETYAVAPVISDNKGVGYYEKTHIIDLFDGDPRFDWIYNVSGRKVVAPASKTNSSALLTKYVDFERNYSLEFDLVGDNITFVHAAYVSAAPSAINMEVWDTLTNTKLGSFTWANDALQWSKESTITFPRGKYRIRLKDASTGSEFKFRLEAIKVKQTIQIRNMGVSGTNTIQWLPGSTYLQALQPTDEFVFVQLGTNDRGNTAFPRNYSKTKTNLEALVRHLLGLNKKVILMCSSVAIGSKEMPNANYYYAMNDVMRAVKEVSEKLSVDFIDNYTPTRKAVIDGQAIFVDELHPNNAGYLIMASNILDRVNRA